VLSGAQGLRRYPHGRGHRQGLESWLHPRKSEAMLWPNPACIIRTDRRTNETRGRQWMSVRESRYVISVFFSFCSCILATRGTLINKISFF
jgi:hypothetical protein